MAQSIIVVVAFIVYSILHLFFVPARSLYEKPEDDKKRKHSRWTTMTILSILKGAILILAGYFFAIV